MSFWESEAGRRLAEGTLPRLAEAVECLASEIRAFRLEGVHGAASDEEVELLTAMLEVGAEQVARMSASFADAPRGMGMEHSIADQKLDEWREEAARRLGYRDAIPEGEHVREPVRRRAMRMEDLAAAKKCLYGIGLVGGEGMGHGPFPNVEDAIAIHGEDGEAIFRLTGEGHDQMLFRWNDDRWEAVT